MTSADISANLKKHPIGTICAIVAIACGIALYLRAGDIAASQVENEARTAEASRMVNNVRNSTNLAEQVGEMETLRKDFEGRLMKTSQLAVNLQYFYKLEAETEVKLIDVRQNNLPRNAAKTLYVGVPFTVSIQGTFAQVTQFVNRLQNGPHFCRINVATFGRAGGDSAAGTGVTLALNLEILGQP